MECYDISTIQGTYTVGSQVTFEHGRPLKSAYKRYKISEENAGDDFAAMREVLTRRARRSKEGDPLPDLIVIDGGPPQLEQALAALDDEGVVACEVVAMAKAKQRARGKKGKRKVQTPERIWLPDAEAAIPLEPDDAVTYLLQRLRDEAHRFAITYHRKLRQQGLFESQLEDVKGVGPKRRHALLDYFGTSGAVKRASLAELMAVPGITAELAQRIFDAFEGVRDKEKEVDEDDKQGEVAAGA